MSVCAHNYSKMYWLGSLLYVFEVLPLYSPWSICIAVTSDFEKKYVLCFSIFYSLSFAFAAFGIEEHQTGNIINAEDPGSSGAH